MDRTIFLDGHCNQGRIQDFKLGGAHLKKLRRAEGGANFFLVFRVGGSYNVLYVFLFNIHNCVVDKFSMGFFFFTFSPNIRF